MVATDDAGGVDRGDAVTKNSCSFYEWNLSNALNRLEEGDPPRRLKWKGVWHDIVLPATVEEMDEFIKLQSAARTKKGAVAILEALAPSLKEWHTELMGYSAALLVTTVEHCHLEEITGFQNWQGWMEWRKFVDRVRDLGGFLLHSNAKDTGNVVDFCLSELGEDSIDVSVRELFKDEVNEWFLGRDVEELRERPESWRELIRLERDLRYGLKLIEAVKRMTPEERLRRSERLHGSLTELS